MGKSNIISEILSFYFQNIVLKVTLADCAIFETNGIFRIVRTGICVEVRNCKPHIF